MLKMTLFAALSSLGVGFSQVARKKFFTAAPDASVLVASAATQIVSGAALLLAVMLSREKIPLKWDNLYWWVAAAGIGFGFGILFFNYAMQFNNINIVTFLTAGMVPLFSVAFAWMILGEKMCMKDALGAAVILAGIGIISWK